MQTDIWVKVMKNKKINLWEHHIPAEFFVSMIILILTFLVATTADLNAAEKKLNITVEYLKDQCNNNELRDLASEAKSLLRISESVEYFKRTPGSTGLQPQQTWIL